MNIRGLLLMSALSLAGTAVVALEEPEPSPDDTRVRLVDYNELDVVRVIGTMRTSVQVVFGQGEEIVDVAIGDTIAWEPKPRGNILFLKAREPHPPSNLQVVTVRADGTTRSYNFELITREGDILNNQENVYFAVRFRYPNDVANARRQQVEAQRAADRAAAQQQAVEVRLRNAAVNAGPRNWQYTYAGPRSLRPTEVFDNGTTTVISFGNSSRMPSVYFSDGAGNERLANTTISNNRIIVQGVAEQIILRRGGAVAGVFNENYGGPGHFSETGTVSLIAPIRQIDPGDLFCNRIGRQRVDIRAVGRGIANRVPHPVTVHFQPFELGLVIHLGAAGDPIAQVDIWQAQFAGDSDMIKDHIGTQR